MPPTASLLTVAETVSDRSRSVTVSVPMAVSESFWFRAAESPLRTVITGVSLPPVIVTVTSLESSEVKMSVAVIVNTAVTVSPSAR